MTAKIAGDDLFGLLREEVAYVADIDPDAIVRSTNLAEDHGIDSLELMEIATRLEDRLGIRLEPDRLTATTTIGEVLSYLEAKLGEASES